MGLGVGIFLAAIGAILIWAEPNDGRGSAFVVELPQGVQ